MLICYIYAVILYSEDTKPMKKHLFPLFFLVVLAFNLSSCGKTEMAQKCSDKFFKLVIKEKYESASKLLEPSTEKEELVLFLKSLHDDAKNGKLLSFEKTTGFNTQMKNDVTTVTLPYALKYEHGERQCEVILVDRGKGFKISSLH